MKNNFAVIVTAFALALLSAACLFAPEEIAQFGGSPAGATAYFIQLYGAAVLGLAGLNWWSRFTLTVGIHGRPLVAANFMHAIAGLGVSLSAIRHRDGGLLSLGFLILYAALAVTFSAILFRRSPPAS